MNLLTNILLIIVVVFLFIFAVLSFMVANEKDIIREGGVWYGLYNRVFGKDRD